MECRGSSKMVAIIVKGNEKLAYCPHCDKVFTVKTEANREQLVIRLPEHHIFQERGSWTPKGL